MRTFIAIEFDELIKEYLWEQLQSLKKYINKGNLVHKENFHLTLNFLGEVTLSQVETLKEVINSAAVNMQPFILKLDGLGQFRKGNTSILWIGTHKSPELELVFDKLKNLLASHGFLVESRGYNPHITLGREVTFSSSFELLSSEITVSPKEIQVEKISLMESTRVEGILKYIQIYKKEFIK